MDNQDHEKQNALQAIIAELTRVVNALAESVRTNKAAFKDLLDENHKRHEAVIHQVMEDHKVVMTELMHDHKDLMSEMGRDHRELTESSERNHREDLHYYEKNETRLTWLSVIVLGVSIVLGGYWSIRQEQIAKREAKLAALYKQEAWLSDAQKNQTTVKNDFMAAGVALRAAASERQLYCKNNRFTGSDPIAYKQKLFLTSYELVGASFNVRGIFDAAIQDKVSSFNADVTKFRHMEPCSKELPTGYVLWKFQDEINTMMLQSIANLKLEREGVIRKVEALEASKK